MTPRDEIRDVAASVHQRLLNRARAAGTDFNLVLQRFVGERFLYRLGLTREVDRFTLKGAALFLVWTETGFRTTRDIDLLGTGSEDHEAIHQAIEAICAVHYRDDGLTFDPTTIRIHDIRDEQNYGGVRVKLRANLGPASLPLQIDIGFGDAVTPARQEAEYPTLLDLPAPRIWIYPRETVVAEKFEVMVHLGPGNSRMKDFWDVVALAQIFDFDGDILRTAFAETFRRRGTAIGVEIPDALQPAFYQEPRRIQLWQAFQTKVDTQIATPARFEEVGERIHTFLGPVWENLVRDEPFSLVWPGGGPWQPAAAQQRGGAGDV